MDVRGELSREQPVEKTVVLAAIPRGPRTKNKMHMKDQNLTTEESLSIITEMINKAKGNVRENSTYFLLWGVVIALANLGMFTLIQLGYSRPQVVWSITIPAWIATIYLGYKHGSQSGSATHLDRISAWLWCSFGVVIFTLVGFGKVINYQLNPVILLFSAIPTVVSGIIIRFRPLVIGGIVFWAMGLISFLVGGPWQFLIGAFAVAVGYLVPGFMLRYRRGI